MINHFIITSRRLLGFKPVRCHTILILLLWLSVSSFSRAQTKVWDKTLGGKSYDALHTMVHTPDGGYILGGESASGKTGDKSEDNYGTKDENGDYPTDYWIVKLDASGKKVWDKTYGGNSYDRIKAIVATSDGGYLLGGHSNSLISGDKSENARGNPDEMGYYNFDYWLIKIDANGNKVWDKIYGGEASDNLNALIALPDGGFLLGGNSDSGKGHDKSEENRGCNFGTCHADYWVIRIDATGKKIWDKTLGAAYVDNLSALVTTPDGGYLVGGSSGSAMGGDKSEESKGDSDYWLVKLDAQGKKLWDKTLGGSNADALYSVLLNPDGSYLLGGYSVSGKGGDKSRTYAGYWVVKVNARGNKIWDKSYGGKIADQFSTMVATPDGGYLLGGSSFRGIGGDKSEEKGGYWMVKINSNGALVWEKAYDSGYLTTLLFTLDNHFLLGGYSSAGITTDKSEKNRTPEGEYPREDYWIIKIKENKHNQKGQTITLATSLLVKTLGNAPVTLTAKASSGLPVTFKLVSGPGTLKNNILTFTGIGTITVKATQPGNQNYKPAPEVTQTIIVDKPSVVTKLWDRRFGGPRNDNLADIVATPDGGFFLGGSSNSGVGGDKSQGRRDNSDYWVIKIDSSRNKEWDYTFGDFSGFGSEIISKVLATKDGGYLVGGSYHSASVDGNFYHFWLIKLNSKGQQEWEKSFGNEASFSTMIATPDGGYLLGGSASINSTKDKTEAGRGEDDYWLVKIDAAGNKQWDKVFGGDKTESITALLATPDGGYLVGGNSGSGKSGDKSENNQGTPDLYDYQTMDYWLIKLDAKGSKLWDKTLGGNNQDLLRSLLIAPDGGYLLGGSSRSGKSGDKSAGLKDTTKAFEWQMNDFWVVKIDAHGQKLWDKTLGGNNLDELTDMLVTLDGNFLLGGTSGSGIGEDKSEAVRAQEGIMGSDFWLIKLDSNGKKLWDKTLGGDGNDGLASIIPLADNAYVLGGYSTSEISGDKSEPDRSSAPSGRGDYWVVKIKEELPVTVAWNFRYGGSGNDNFASAIKTPDGGYLSGGYTNSGVSGDKSESSQGKNDYWIVKSDKNGKKQWDKRYGGSQDDYLNRVINTQDGGYLLAGSSFSGKSGDKSEPSKGERDYWVVKTDAQGNKQWDKTFGSSGEDELRKVIQLSSGEYVLGGSSNSPVSGDKTQASQGNTDYWILKISNTGTVIWDQRYGGSGAETLGSFLQTLDGGFLLGGTSYSGKSGNKSQTSRGEEDYWVVKIDKNGSFVWEKTFGGSRADKVYSVGRSQDNYFISGTSSSGKNDDKSQNSQGGQDYWLVTLDTHGNKIWDRTFGGSKDDELRASTYTSQGHYILAGNSYSGISGDKSQMNQGESDYWVVEIDQQGNKVQDQGFGGSGTEELRTATQTQDGGLLLVGRSGSGVSGNRTQPSQGGTDYWLVKVAPETSSLVAARTTTIMEQAMAPTGLPALTAYPNPFQERLAVSITLPETQPTTVKVIDSQGREVTTLFHQEAKANQTYQVEWQTGNKPNGLYFLQLQTPTQRNTQKLLLSK